MFGSAKWIVNVSDLYLYKAKHLIAPESSLPYVVASIAQDDT